MPETRCIRIAAPSPEESLVLDCLAMSDALDSLLGQLELLVHIDHPIAKTPELLVVRALLRPLAEAFNGLATQLGGKEAAHG
jgi:hypothetical protein